MARPRLSSLFFVVFHLQLVLISATSEAKSDEHPKKHVHFFIFGDSFLDAGNNNYINTTTLDQANFWPYGETHFNFPTGRFSDGRLMVDFIAEYANLPLILPFLQPGIDQYRFGVNFASGGAGALVETFQGDDVYELGGRKFAFINLPELGCLPAMRIIKPENNGKCLEEASLLATLHNKALSKLLFGLEKQLKGFRYSIYDFKTSLHQRMKHPSKYGLKQGKAACCGTGKFRGVYSCGGKRAVKEFELCKNPNEYLFWDSFHLTEMAYKQLADEMWGGNGNSLAVGPYNLKQLFQN
ncbi:hypothetical protein MANES_11G013800v8 [Manihot esculenta]|uniref:Uncharacterized protein n=1 Tax=Manihot esculenta TaxID=3983 RepID=A0A2C9UXH9_MANES|nr:hypothetical protein MANES_11G013800v8 [Manihot esculenta]